MLYDFGWICRMALIANSRSNKGFDRSRRSEFLNVPYVLCGGPVNPSVKPGASISVVEFAAPGRAAPLQIVRLNMPAKSKRRTVAAARARRSPSHGAAFAQKTGLTYASTGAR